MLIKSFIVKSKLRDDVYTKMCIKLQKNITYIIIRVAIARVMIYVSF